MLNGKDDRAPGPTFALEQVGFIDFEARAPVDLKEAGAYCYATEADAIVLSYAIGFAPVRRMTVRNFLGPLDFADWPLDLTRHHAKVISGTAVWAAWNAAFDKAIWNYATIAFPEMKPEHIIDVMAQGAASGLPPDLSMAARLCGGEHVKDKAGPDLIRLFCLPTSTATPTSHPAEWLAFLRYADRDVAALRDVFTHTRQLPLAEWREYWAMEAINERGVGIDIPMVTHAAKLADEDKVRSRAELVHLTNDPAMTVDKVAKLTAWLLERLPPEGRAILTKRDEEVDEETGEVKRPPKFALTRRRVEKLIAYVNDLEIGHLDAVQIEPPNGGSICTANAADVLRLLQIRLYGGSKTPQKFRKMLGQAVDGVLFGQYVFNGAGQTGRASSRGVQVHNLARDTLAHEHDAIEALLYGCHYEELAALRGEFSPVARKLSLLIRPAFVAAPGNLFVWSDWSQIEARVLPWLCDHHAGARQRLQIFRDVDADPDLPDLYTRTASVLSKVEIHSVTKPMRQRGKVAELALGFCGGVGALQAMAAGYGLHLSDADARKTVDDWREANPWSRDYSRELWEAMHFAVDLRKTASAGRVRFTFLPAYLDGTLVITLPSGRLLTYRSLRPQMMDVLDEDGEPTGEKRREMTFARGYGRVKLWPGMFVENVTQAVAADVLRGTLVRLEKGGYRTRLHTHDEVLLEADEAAAGFVEANLRRVMRQGFDWSDGLPIMSEETIAPYYTKAGD